MRSDDLVPILAPDPGKPVGFRQGVIVSWNKETAENVVLVGNSLMENLPILNTSEAAILSTGDVVSILTSGSTWGIMGRYTIPGTPEAVSSIKAITNRIVVASNSGVGTRNSTAWGDLTGTEVGPVVTATVGSSGRAMAIWSCEIGQTSNFWGTKNTPHVGIEVTGASAVSPSDVHSLNFAMQQPASGAPGYAVVGFWMQAAMMHVYTGLNPGETTFTMKYRHDTLDPPGDSSFNAREIAIFVL